MTNFEVDVRLIKLSGLISASWQQAAAQWDLSPTAVHLLLALRKEDDVPMGRFPQVCPATKSNVTAVVDSLEERGLVMRHPDSADRRVIRIRLTEEGRHLAARLPSHAELFADSPTAHLSPEERDQLCRLLEKIESPLEVMPVRSN